MNRTATAVMPRTHCSHHWVIEMPAGPTSKGRCELCGEERMFQNSRDDYGMGAKVAS